MATRSESKEERRERITEDMQRVAAAAIEEGAYRQGNSVLVNVDRRTLPSQDRLELELVAVLLWDTVQCGFRCYVGVGSPEWVAQNGSKLHASEVGSHFPGAPEDMYVR